ncbi:lipopolysaccharide kinase InaA family protein [Sulfurimonas sp. HSL3-7]|uniref:lipopolysaccharide kinase InaA family protein n=1 Tax=Sulfonitrofixus jiaomeiensis TaxID=3131938 RepID=UPI0031F77560
MQQLSNRYQISLNPKYESCRDFCEHIDIHFDDQQESMHKARNEIKKIPCAGYTFVVKSFKVPHLLNRIVYTYFRGSKAKKSYENALKLQQLNINTPEPVAAIQELTPTLHKSYFISIAFDYDFTLRAPLRNPDFEDRVELFQAFARFTAKLHENGVLHNDYSQGNILIKKEQDDYTFSVVDINRMEFRPLSRQERYKNFSRLWADRDVLEIIAKEYAKIAGYDVQEAIDEICAFDQKHKKFKQFKRLFKKQK